MSALAGRERELAELAARVNLTRSGRSSALVVYGEAGIGKSALLDHRAERAPRSGAADGRLRVRGRAALRRAAAALRSADGSGRRGCPRRSARRSRPRSGCASRRRSNPFLVGLSVLGLLTEVAGDRGAALHRRRRAVARRGLRAGARVRRPPARRRGDHDRAGDAHRRRGVRRPSAARGRGARRRRRARRAAARVPGRARPARARPADRRGARQPARAAGAAARAEPGRDRRRVRAGRLDPAPAAHRAEPARAARAARPGRLACCCCVAAADPTGDPELLWRASAALGLGTRAPRRRGAMRSRSGRASASVIRSCARRSITRRRPRTAGASTPHWPTPRRVERDPDRRAWHRVERDARRRTRRSRPTSNAPRPAHGSAAARPPRARSWSGRRS